MAEAQVALDTNNDRSNHYSRPVFKQVLKVNSLQAQRVMERSFERVSNSLFSIDVILRIIGEQDEIDQVAQFAHLIRKLDTLMGIVDTLWLNTVLTSKQRTDATYQWQQRLIKLAGRIIGIEKRARISAHSKGKEGEVAEAAPESATGDKEIADEAEKTKAA
ncbi:hypothetical protein ACOV3A_004568 [Citrobacter freundii]